MSPDTIGDVCPASPTSIPSAIGIADAKHGNPMLKLTAAMSARMIDLIVIASVSPRSTRFNSLKCRFFERAALGILQRYETKPAPV